MEFTSIRDIVIIVGNYGSGKTEVSVNLALYQSMAGVTVRIADLDLVNPYFRTREVRDLLRHHQVDVVLPPEQYLHADLPILTPAVLGMIRSPAPLTILDAGGDDVGATVLASLSHGLKEQVVRTFQVVNPFRPFTDTISGCLRIKREIEAAAKLAVSGVIGNANLLDETEAEHIVSGYDFVHRFAAEAGLPLVFVTAPESLLPLPAADGFACPVLPIRRQLVPPWRTADQFRV